MAEYALVKDGSLLKVTDSDNESPTFPPDISHKGLEWIPVVRDPQPDFDPATQSLEASNGVISGQYVYGWTVRSKTAQEQADHQNAIDRSAVREGLLDLAEIVIIHIDAHLAKGNLAASDFNAATRQKYQALKAAVDRLRA